MKLAHLIMQNSKEFRVARSKTKCWKYLSVRLEIKIGRDMLNPHVLWIKDAFESTHSIGPIFKTLLPAPGRIAVNSSFEADVLRRAGQSLLINRLFVMRPKGRVGYNPSLRFLSSLPATLLQGLVGRDELAPWALAFIKAQDFSYNVCSLLYVNEAVTTLNDESTAQ